MLPRRTSESSSSSDDESRQTPFNVPSVNLASLRKKDKKKSAKSQFSLAKKKITGAGKHRQVPDSHTYNRSTVLSTSSNFSSSSDLDDLLVSYVSDRRSQREGSVKDLPNFKFNVPTQQQGRSNASGDFEDDDDDDDEDGNDDTDEYGNPKTYNAQPMVYDDDSSDNEEPQRTHSVRSAHSRQSVGSRGSKQSHHSRASRSSEISPGRRTRSIKSASIKSRNSHEIDIADARRPSASNHSANSKDSNTMRNIFRRMSLKDQMDSPDAPSNSDTFLGRVLSLGSGGLAGGGMAPGMNRPEVIDEEKDAGNPPGGDSIEMKNLQYSDLNDAAKDLILAHAPELAQSKKTPKVAFETPEKHDSSPNAYEHETKEGSSVEHEAGTVPATPEEEHTNPFYQPNPDLLREHHDGGDDDFLLEGDGGYVAPPKQVHAGVLSSLLKLYQNPTASKSGASIASSEPRMLADEQMSDEENMPKTGHHGITKSFTDGGRKLAGKLHMKKGTPTSPKHEHSENESDGDNTDRSLDGEAAGLPSFQNARPKIPKPNVSHSLGKKLKSKKDRQLRITVHIADILQRQRFIIRMCKALMLYGAPTHRLEEYMIMTSRVLEIDGQFVYFPGTMLIAFGDAATRTSEVHLVRCAQGVNLSKLSDTHKIYKGVIHDLMGVDEAATKLEELLKSKNQFPGWVCVLTYGIGSGAVCTFGFGGGWKDVPIALGIGLIIGYLQYFVSSKSNLYSSVFEVTSSIVVSFIARAIGSIHHGDYFCFGSITQGSLALILPGYIILCGSLELQSKNLVAGSVRMFYAVIYSLFLGFGITLGAALFGWVYKGATDKAQCGDGHAMNDKWRILMVPLFTTCLGVINQARWRQLPVMLIISCTSYLVTYFAGKHFLNVTEFTAAIGAFIIGIMGNMYSRIGRGMAVSAMLPAIFVQVPSGIASKSTLLAGVDTANRITNSSKQSTTTDVSSLAFGATMVEVAIGISVGLFAAALVVYPFGKRKTSLFTL